MLNPFHFYFSTLIHFLFFLITYCIVTNKSNFYLSIHVGAPKPEGGAGRGPQGQRSERAGRKGRGRSRDREVIINLLRIELEIQFGESINDCRDNIAKAIEELRDEMSKVREDRVNTRTDKEGKEVDR